jgi:two-component system, response regulator PdtaR
MKAERILIIEDEAIISECIKEILNNLGYRHVESADNAAAGLEILRRNDYDVVLMDINLGEGTDGIDIINELKKTKKVPVIYLTGNSDPLTLGKAKTTLPVAFITKPVSETNLRVQLELFLQSRK